MVKDDVVSYNDLSIIAEGVVKKVESKFGIKLTPSNVLEIVRIAVFEYGFKCLLNGHKFVLRRMGTWKVNHYKRSEISGKDYFTQKKQKIEKAKSKKVKEVDEVTALVIDLSENSGIFASLNDVNKETKIVNNNGSWNGNFGKSEFRPDAKELE